MKIQAGKKYRRRNGDIVTLKVGNYFAECAWTADKFPADVRADGTAPCMSTDFDIVSEVFEVHEGGYYRTRAGEVVGPLRFRKDRNLTSAWPFTWDAVGDDSDCPRHWATEEGYGGGVRENERFVEEVPAPAPKLRLQVGRRYKTRDGRVTGPLHNTEGWIPSFNFEGIVSDWGNATWNENGRWSSSLRDNPIDLVEEYVEVPKPFNVTFEVPKPFNVTFQVQSQDLASILEKLQAHNIVITRITE